MTQVLYMARIVHNGCNMGKLGDVAQWVKLQSYNACKIEIDLCRILRINSEI